MVALNPVLFLGTEFMRSTSATREQFKFLLFMITWLAITLSWSVTFGGLFGIFVSLFVDWGRMQYPVCFEIFCNILMSEACRCNACGFDGHGMYNRSQ